MIKIKSVKEQYEIRDACLKERLEIILPHRFSLCMPSEELAPYYESYWTDFNNEDQMACLNRLCNEFDPKNIAVNVSDNFSFSDGLTQGLYEMLTNKMDTKYVERIVRNDLLAIKLMELRTP